MKKIFKAHTSAQGVHLTNTEADYFPGHNKDIGMQSFLASREEHLAFVKKLYFYSSIIAQCSTIIKKVSTNKQVTSEPHCIRKLIHVWVLNELPVYILIHRASGNFLPLRPASITIIERMSKCLVKFLKPLDQG